MKEKPHATPVKFDASRYDTARFDTARLDAKPVIGGQSDLRAVLLPAVGAVTLVVLFFVLLLSTPSTRPTESTVAVAVDSVAVDSVAVDPVAVNPAVDPVAANPAVDPVAVNPAIDPVAVPTGVLPTAATTACNIPQVAGKAGIVGTRFLGKKTSNGHRYEPTEPTCIVNAAGLLANLPYGSEVRLARVDGGPQTAVCQVIGRWNGNAHTDRILLISGKVADELEFGQRGLLDVATDCPNQTTASREPVPGRAGDVAQAPRAAEL